jgi:hypothetical protein
MSETYEQMEARRQADYNKQHDRHNKQPKGYEHNVPCPWCSKHNDHTGLPREQGLVVDCDHCGGLMTVVKVIQKPVIVVTQCHDQPKPPYVPKDRDQWEAEEKERARTSAAQENIEKEDQKRASLLGSDKDLVIVLRALSWESFKTFVRTRNSLGRVAALATLPELQRQQAKQE